MKSHIFNIASGKAYTFQEMARMVEEIIPVQKISVGPGLLKYSETVEEPEGGSQYPEGAIGVRLSTELRPIPRPQRSMKIP